MRYHRAKTKGGTFFFTVVTFKQMRILTEKSNVDLLRASLKHVEYIHYNPVHHKYVTIPKSRPYSSFHRYEHEGKYDSALGMGSEIAG